MAVKEFPLVTWNPIQYIRMKRCYQKRVSYNHSLTVQHLFVSLWNSPVPRSVGLQYHPDPGELVLTLPLVWLNIELSSSLISIPLSNSFETGQPS